MANFLNSDEVHLGFALRKLLTEYNMKPILTRPQHRFYTDGSTYFEAVIDVHLFSYVCRRGFSTMKFALPRTLIELSEFSSRPILSSMIWDVGFTIEV